MAKKSKSANKLEAMPACDLDYRARGDMETLRRAKEIEGDRQRLAAARREAQKDMKALEAVAKRK